MINFLKFTKVSLMCTAAFITPVVYFTSTNFTNKQNIFTISREDYNLLQEEKNRFDFRDNLESKYGKCIDARVRKFLNSYKKGDVFADFELYDGVVSRDNYALFELMYLDYEEYNFTRYNPDASAIMERYVENLVNKRLVGLGLKPGDCKIDVSSEDPSFGHTRIIVGIGFGSKVYFKSIKDCNDHINSIISSVEDISKC